MSLELNEPNTARSYFNLHLAPLYNQRIRGPESVAGGRNGYATGVVPNFLKLQKLDFLFLSGSTLTNDGIDALNEGLPGCVISIHQGGVF